MRNDKDTAIALRRAGKSYNEISRELDIPKSTLSAWFAGQAYSSKIKESIINQSKKQWAKNITVYNKKRAQLLRQKQADITQESKKQISPITKKELLLVGTSLYWAEGYKRSRWNIIFTNSDELMIRLIMKFFRVVCNVPMEKIKIQVQVHSINQVSPANQYWSSITKIPLSQFRNPLYQITRSSKGKVKRTLIYGTCRIIINDVTLVSRIQGWIQGLAQL